MFWRQAAPATLVGMLGFVAYSIAWPDILTPRDSLPGVLVLVQSILLMTLLGRYGSPAFAFLYSRGYSRDVLWGHMVLTSAASAIVAVLPGSLIIWLGVRSDIHDRLLNSPFYPIMAPREMIVPIAWLGLYMLLLPACHYAWIRAAQPTRGRLGGICIILGLIAALLVMLSEVHHLSGWFAGLAWGSYVAVIICLMLGSRALHRTLEVRT